MPITRVSSDFSPEKRYLVGVSGGRDSVALLHWLVSAKFTDLVVCHLDHGLRGGQSAEDADFVERLAAHYQVNCERAIARLESQSENVARNARFEFFARCALKYGTHELFLAHHADDQAETILLNLSRGAGTGGLVGMKSTTSREVSGTTLTLHRPWLPVTRVEIDEYVTQHELDFREDPTNSDPEYTARNRLRVELGRSLNREITPAILRTSELLRADDECLESFLDQQWENLLDPEGRLRVGPLREVPLAIQRRGVRRWLRYEHGISNIGMREIEQIIDLLGPPQSSPAKVNLPENNHVKRRQGRIFVEKSAF